jgi:DNA-binding CsgD family transcriptional regulator/tetratricopeptide (TPR) repeat protein
VVHHAVEAGDDAAVVAHAPVAAQQARRAGAHAQEVRLYEHVLSRRRLLAPIDQAAMWQASASALFTLDRMPEALEAGTAAVRIREELGERAALGEALIALAPVYWGLTQPRAAVETAARAVRLLGPEGDSPRHTFALTYLGLLLQTEDRCEEALAVGVAAVAMAQRSGVAELEAFSRTLRGRARLQLGDDGGLEEMLLSIRMATAVPNHLYAMIGYVCVVQELWRLGRFAEADVVIDEGSAYAQERDFDTYLDHLAAHRLRLRALRGEWEAAEIGLRALLGDRARGEAGSVRQSLPALARLLVRRGAYDAEEMLGWARDYAGRAGGLYELFPASMAEIEQAWLTGQPDRALAPAALLLERTVGSGWARQRGELLRWLRRLGQQVGPFDGCPDEFAAGLRGDWHTAATAWARAGAPYERALELADSGEPESTLEALAVLDALGARPAAALVRRRLRELGVATVPRGPRSATRSNVAGLTDRQLEILELLARNMTNVEIAARLVVSVRTVDHHVSAVLQKLGVATRREAAAAAARITDAG